MSDPVLIGRIAIALALSSAIGLEREFRHKPAGVRTIAVVGLGAAVAMMVSKYGFFDMHDSDVTLDPSRVAAQIVSGVGFLGAGIIIVRRDSVSGLTTAAVVWGTAMIGMAVGAGMILLSVAATATYFVIALVYPSIVRRIPHSPWSSSALRVTYVDHRGVLRDVLQEVTQHGVSVSSVDVDRNASADGRVALTLYVDGKAPSTVLATAIERLDGVLSVRAGEPNDD